MASVPRIQVAMNLPRRKTSYIARARAIVLAMSREPLWQRLAALLRRASAALDELLAAEVSIRGGGLGKTQVRDRKYSKAHTLMMALCGRVEEWANANPEHAMAGIASAGMAVKRPKSRTKALFASKQGRISGQVILSAKMVAKRCGYEWQYSTDGVNWSESRSTLQATVTFEGLKPGVLHKFRFRWLTKDGEGNWSEVISRIVT